MTSTRVSRARSFLVSYMRAVSRDRLSGIVSGLGRARTRTTAARERPSRRLVVVWAICISSSTGQCEVCKRRQALVGASDLTSPRTWNATTMFTMPIASENHAIKATTAREHHPRRDHDPHVCQGQRRFHERQPPERDADQSLNQEAPPAIEERPHPQ